MRKAGIFYWILCLVLLQAGAVPCTTLAAGPDNVAGKVQRIEITIQNRRVVRDDNVIRVTQGEKVELVWTTDESASLHLHGYDIEFNVTPVAPTPVAFTAHATGRFPVTSHGFENQQGHGHNTLLYIEVYPK